MRLIDADAMKDRIKNYMSVFAKKDWREICEMLNDAPTVDADPVKHGHWIEVQRIHEKDHTAICECSLCEDTVWVYDGQRAWNYCPNCGAKMDEVTEDGKAD